MHKNLTTLRRRRVGGGGGDCKGPSSCVCVGGCGTSTRLEPKVWRITTSPRLLLNFKVIDISSICPRKCLENYRKRRTFLEQNSENVIVCLDYPPCSLLCVFQESVECQVSPRVELLAVWMPFTVHGRGKSVCITGTITTISFAVDL